MPPWTKDLVMRGRQGVANRSMQPATWEVYVSLVLDNTNPTGVHLGGWNFHFVRGRPMCQCQGVAHQIRAFGLQ